MGHTVITLRIVTRHSRPRMLAQGRKNPCLPFGSLEREGTRANKVVEDFGNGEFDVAYSFGYGGNGKSENSQKFRPE